MRDIELFCKIRIMNCTNSISYVSSMLYNYPKMKPIFTAYVIMSVKNLG